MQVRQGMSEVVLTVGPGHSLREAAVAMVRRKVGAAVVLDPDANGPGVITERDILLSIGAGQDPHRGRRGAWWRRAPTTQWSCPAPGCPRAAVGVGGPAVRRTFPGGCRPPQRRAGRLNSDSSNIAARKGRDGQFHEQMGVTVPGTFQDSQRARLCRPPFSRRR